MQDDALMCKLMEKVYRGFPQTSYDLDPDLRPYFKHQHDLHVVNGVVCYKDRVIVPAKLRPQVLEAIHSAHQGVSGMISRVEDTVWWPAITTDIQRKRGSCKTCARDAPSQPAGTPIPPPVPSYPFQYVVMDYFSLEGRNFLAIGDRFSGWLSIYEAGPGQFDAKSLVNKVRGWCESFNIPEEISTDGGPQLTSKVFQDSLTAWDVRHRLSSVYYPHSNCRAELAVKTAKRLLRDNMGPGGDLNNDRFMRAIMQYRNTPMQDCRMSPAQMVYGRQLRDFLPALHNKLEPMKDWSVTLEHRERMLAKKRDQDGQKWAARTKDLEEIEVGTPVSIQNQTGSHPTKWDKTGVVLENRPYQQVLVKVDGSRRATLRNRRFVRPLYKDLKRNGNPNLQPLETAVPPPPHHTDLGRETRQDIGPQDVIQPNEEIEEQIIEQQVQQPGQPDQTSAVPQQHLQEQDHPQHLVQEDPQHQNIVPDPATEEPQHEGVLPRRGQRTHKPPQRYNPEEYETAVSCRSSQETEKTEKTVRML